MFLYTSFSGDTSLVYRHIVTTPLIIIDQQQKITIKVGRVDILFQCSSPSHIPHILPVIGNFNSNGCFKCTTVGHNYVSLGGATTVRCTQLYKVIFQVTTYTVLD